MCPRVLRLPEFFVKNQGLFDGKIDGHFARLRREFAQLMGSVIEVEDDDESVTLN